MTVAKPRYRFCWSCSRQLQGRHHRLVRAVGHNEPVICHVACANEMVREGEGAIVEASP